MAIKWEYSNTRTFTVSILDTIEFGFDKIYINNVCFDGKRVETSWTNGFNLHRLYKQSATGYSIRCGHCFNELCFGCALYCVRYILLSVLLLYFGHHYLCLGNSRSNSYFRGFKHPQMQPGNCGRKLADDTNTQHHLPTADVISHTVHPENYENGSYLDEFLWLGWDQFYLCPSRLLH